MQIRLNAQYNTCENVVCLIVLIVHLKLNKKIQYVNEIKGNLSVCGVYFHDCFFTHLKGVL